LKHSDFLTLFFYFLNKNFQFWFVNRNNQPKWNTMKRHLLLIAAVMFCLNINAQYPCFNGISTNPLNPINNQLPAKKNTFFNWQDSLWAMQPSTQSCNRSAISESPFYKINNLEELRESRDMKWEDGWELIKRDVGLTETNNNTASFPEEVNVILYNKYTGILRVILMVCRGADYNAARVTLKFHELSEMKTDLLEFSRSQISALDKTFSLTQAVAGVPYSNPNAKYFYADFPMMYDPCTCNYKSKLHITSDLISTATINIEGGITGDIHTRDVGGKAQVQKLGTYSWKDFTSTVNGKVTAVYGSINKFLSESQGFASNLARLDTSSKSAMNKLADFLKKNNFLLSGLNAVPWLKTALSVVDIFSGGGRTSSGPQEVKLMPLAVNLTAKLSGTIATVNPYHTIIFSNPGSKDAVLDPDIYPYYNEVLGVFNLLKAPTLYTQSNNKLIADPENGNTIRIKENRYRLDLSTLKYVLNAAAGVTIQNMRAAIVIEGQNRNFPVCANSERVIPPDFVFEGKDGITNVDKFRTDYFDMVCLGSRMFQANSYYNAIAAESASGPLVDVGCPNAYTSKGYIKFMINLKRNNAGPNTQNILFVATFPCKVVADNSLTDYQTNFLCNDSSIIASASVAEINGFCNSTEYYQASRHNRVNRDTLTIEQRMEKYGFAISPNPNTGVFTLRFKQQKAVLKNIIVSSINGQKVFEQNAGNINLSTGLNRQLNVSLQSGLYIVSCNTDKGILKTKMMVMK
jgi:hypothetical protein